jgi:hypothetical protein
LEVTQHEPREKALRERASEAFVPQRVVPVTRQPQDGAKSEDKEPIGVAGGGDAYRSGEHKQGTDASRQQTAEEPKSSENEDRSTQRSGDHWCAPRSVNSSTGSIGSPLTSAFSRARSAGPRRMMWV